MRFRSGASIADRTRVTSRSVSLWASRHGRTRVASRSVSLWASRHGRTRAASMTGCFGPGVPETPRHASALTRLAASRRAPKGSSASFARRSTRRGKTSQREYGRGVTGTPAPEHPFLVRASAYQASTHRAKQNGPSRGCDYGSTPAANGRDSHRNRYKRPLSTAIVAESKKASKKATVPGLVQLFQDGVEAVLGVAEQHAGVLFEEQRVLHAGVACGHAAL